MNKKINVTNVDKLNKKFASIMAKLENYTGTDPESVIQTAYNKYFSSYFGIETSDIVRVEKCDSYFKSDSLVTLIEYKFDVDFNDVLTRYKVLAQTLFYYKRIIEKGKDEIPNVIFIGDVNECFCLRPSLFSKYLDLPGVDYSVAPSSAGSQSRLIEALMNDENIKKELFIINPQKDNMSYICEKMISISTNKTVNIPINRKNIHRVFESFTNKVVNDPKYDVNEIVGLFIDAIKYPERRIIAGDMMIVHPYKPIKVFTNKAIALFNFFSKPSDEDAKNLAMIYDTLVQDSERRKKGFFITQQIWTDLAHKYVADYFESIGWDRNWEDNDNVVCWDCCCGTKSLTRDYRFKNLYLSTLEEGELNASVELSPEAKETFIFDFLNDPISKLPTGLQEELKSLAKNKNRKLVFLTNPPYGQASGNSGVKNNSVCKTVTQNKLKDCGCGRASQELIVQFLYRMTEICDEFKLNRNQVIVATFSKPTFMCGGAYKNFRTYFLNRFSYISGFLFNASEFTGCSNAWGVSFSVWNNINNGVTEFLHDVFDNIDNNPVKTSQHTMYNADNCTPLSQTLKDEICKKGKLSVDTKDGITIFNNKTGKWFDEQLAVFYSNSDLIKDNATYKNMFSIPFVVGVKDKRDYGMPVTANNIDKTVCAYTVKSVIDATWINEKDGYLAPSKNDNIFNTLSYILCGLESSVTSMSGTVDGESYDYKNNFFPFSKSYTYRLLGKQLMKNETDEKRWCLANGKFDNPTLEGQAVLDAFANLIKASAPFRDEYSRNHPELRLDRWDAGFRQLRDLVKEACPEELKEYKAKLKVLKEKLRPMVYELGFLRK